jgi:hypothetical protein
MRVKKGLVLLLIFTLLIGTTVVSALTNKKTPKNIIINNISDEEPTLKDNAFQYKGEDTWIEWWFFTMHDDTKDIQLLFSYSILLNETSGLAIMMVVGFDKYKKYDIRDYYDKSEFNASYDKPDVTIGEECKIEALDENIFIIKGETQNRKIIWNFTYSRLIKPYKHSGDFGWLCYLPSAEATGDVTIDGINYNITGIGYHDHNWMTITNDMPTQWRWAEMYDANNNISIIFSIVGNYIFDGDLAVIIGNETIIFDKPQISYINFDIKFAISQKKFILAIYPKSWHILADNGDYIANFNINVYKTQPLYLGGKTRLVNEQVSRFKGNIKSKDNLYTFETIGFSEYTKFRIFDLF